MPYRDNPSLEKDFLNETKIKASFSCNFHLLGKSSVFRVVIEVRLFIVVCQ